MRLTASDIVSLYRPTFRQDNQVEPNNHTKVPPVFELYLAEPHRQFDTEVLSQE